jgi:polar amino acid transport system substrate-binding protein
MKFNPVSRRRLLAYASASAAALALPARGAAPSPPPLATPASEVLVQALAPTGRLRTAINLGNPTLAARDAKGQVFGVSVDLARALAAELGVEAELRAVDSAARAVTAVRYGEADIGFFALDPQRSDGIAFSKPYLLIEGAYLVRAGSPITDNAQVDQPGTRVMVGAGSAYDLYLARELKAARLLRAPTSPAVVDRFLAEGADVAAGVRQQLQADAARLPGLRVLPGRFMVIEQAMGLQAGRGGAAEACLRDFVERMKASGFVARALERHGILGADVAPSA